MTDFERIDAARRQRALSVNALCRAASVATSTYWRAQKGGKLWPKTVRKLNAALDGRKVPTRQENDRAVADLYRAYVVIIAKERGIDPEKVLASDPQARATLSPEWREAADVRALAVYCVSQFLGVSGARVGFLVGLTRQAVSLILRRVEDFREDPEIDALVKRVGGLVSGEEAAWL